MLCWLKWYNLRNSGRLGFFFAIKNESIHKSRLCNWICCIRKTIPGRVRPYRVGLVLWVVATIDFVINNGYACSISSYLTVILVNIIHLSRRVRKVRVQSYKQLKTLDGLIYVCIKKKHFLCQNNILDSLLYFKNISHGIFVIETFVLPISFGFYMI